MPAFLPPDEAQRLAALQRYQILDTPPEAGFDRITALAARLFRVSIVQISLVDHERQWFKSCFGTQDTQTGRDVSFCAHAILSSQVLVVPDATLDARFQSNALVTVEGGIRFYAGAPLRTSDGFQLGTLCLIDSRPRDFSAEEAATLADLAAIVVDELELRQAGQQLRQEIGEREQSQQALRSSEERARSIISAAHDPFVSMDAAGIITDWNRRAEETFGWARHEAIGRALAETIVPHRYRSAHWKGLDKYLQTGEGPVLNTSIEISALHRDGREFPIELSISPVVVGGERLFTAFVRDISERKRVEAELSQSQKFAESIAEHSTSIIYVFDLRALTNVYANRNVAEFLGYSQQQIEAMGHNFLPSVVHPDDLGFMMSHLSHFERLPDGEVIEFESRFRHANGSWRWLWNRESVFKRDEAGVPIQILGTAQDITERQEAALAIEESERRFAAFMRYVPGVAFMKDREGRYAYVNESFENLFGLSLDYLKGKSDEEVWPPEVAAELRANDREVLEQKRAVQVVETVPQADGPHFWLSSKFPILDAAGEAVMLAAVSIDITERARSEQELKEFAARLERSNRELERSNRELQDFSYVASHDLQEPLRKIRAFGDRLQARHGAKLDDSGRAYIDFMQEAAARMQTLIEDLLNYSRVTTRAQPFALVDLAETTRQVLADLELRVEQTGGEVELGELPSIEADATQMRQLLQNLIGNALKFHRPGVPPRVQIEAQLQGEMCEITVRDNGIGFEEKYLDRIFQPFQRLHGREAYEGTGIGLAICRKIAERHGGRITARSTPGSGTTFCVSLPLQQSASLEPASEQETQFKPGEEEAGSEENTP